MWRPVYVQSQMIWGEAHCARTTAALFPRVMHRRSLICENAAAQSVGFNDDPMILVIATDDQTGRLLA